MMNYEYRLARLANSDIVPCAAPLPEGWAQRFHIGDRVRMRSTRIVVAEYSPIPTGLYGTLVDAHTFDSGWGDPDNRATRPLEIAWGVAGMGFALADWFPVGQLNDAQIAGYAMTPTMKLDVVKWWMHPCHVHITKHASGISVARLFDQSTKWLNHVADAAK